MLWTLKIHNIPLTRQLLKTVRLDEVCAKLKIRNARQVTVTITNQRTATLTHCDNKIMAHKRQKTCFLPGRGIAPLTPELFSRVTLICWAEAFLFPVFKRRPAFF